MKDYQRKQDDIFKLWSSISSNRDLYQIGTSTTEVTEKHVSDLYKHMQGDLKKIYGQYDDDYITECGLAIQILKSCDGTDSFFKVLDTIEYHSSDLKWVIRNYIKKIALEINLYSEIANNLESSAFKTIESYIELKEVPLSTTLDRTKDYYMNVIDSWQSNKSLETLWDERDFQNLSWEGDKTAFYSLFVLNKDKFIKIIQKFEDPYSCKMALHSIDNELTIHNWHYIVNHAESAFDEQGTWNEKRILTPLLMYYADFKISLFLNSFHTNTDTTQIALDSIKYAIDGLVDYVINVLYTKEALGTFRWILYNFRELRTNEIIQTLDKIEDELPQLHTYLQSKLILDFIALNPNTILPNKIKSTLVTWDNNLDYEVWFAHIFLSLYIETIVTIDSNINSEQLIENLGVLKITEAFFSKWHFNICNWYSEDGDSFRKLSSDFNYYNKLELKNDKYYFLSFLLFLSIKKSNSLKLWNNILLSSDLFLDILQFQKYRDIDYGFDNHSYTRYTLSLFSIIGLNLTILLANDKNKLARSVYRSFYQMAFRAFESDTISKQHFSAIKFLSFLRLDSENKEKSDFEILFHNSLPTIHDYLYALQPHDKEFFELLYFLKQNGLKSDVISSIVKGQYNVKLRKQLSSFNQMIVLDKKRYDFPKHYLDFLRTLEALVELMPSS
ncbi:hypothetical protein [Psychrobacter fozii]|uniref:hypothetical protein n=1 Tax=Psychrobacter fozii TaxID=198480 RepID=UPI001917E437|nr:hypothetical protein [Psychrobacter fozii]